MRILLRLFSASLIFWVALQPFIPCLGAAVPDAQSAKEQKVVSSIRVIELEGSPYDRGFKHGSLLKNEIKAVIATWKSDIQKDFKKPPDEVINNFVNNTNFKTAINRWTPGLYDEIKGIADGAGLDFNTVYAFQLMDEFWKYNSKPDDNEHCSSIGIQPGKNNPAIIAQNMDLECFRNGYQVLLHIKYPDSALESYVLTCAGLIGLNGMNNKRIAVCCNTLDMLNNCNDGLPVSCVIRGVLEKKTKKDAVKFIKGIKHASGQNYVIGTPEGVYDFECSSNQVVQVKLPDMKTAVWHTNITLVNNDCNSKFRKLISEQKTNSDIDDSMTRLKTLGNELKNPLQYPVDQIKGLLTSREAAPYALCRLEKDNQGVFTFGSTIMILSDRPELLITSGPPNTKSYQQFTF